MSCLNKFVFALAVLLACTAISVKADTFTLDPPGLTASAGTLSGSGSARGDYITALNNFSITSVGIQGTPASSSLTLVANIFSATGNMRGNLQATSSFTFNNASGLAFYDVPLNFTFTGGMDYDISISFGNPGASGNFAPQIFSFDNPNNVSSAFFNVGPIQVRDGELGQTGLASNTLTPRLRVITAAAVTVPEPSTMLLLGIGLLGACAPISKRRRFRHR